MHILIVEDDPASLAAVCEAVEMFGHATTCVSSAEEALERFADTGADVVLSDWLLPGMHGPDLCREVRRNPNKPYAYFVLLTALSSREDLFSALEVGVDDYITKPFDLDDLGARLRVAQRAVEAHREREVLLRLEGVLLAGRTAQHELNNRLSLTVGYAELLATSQDLPPHLRMYAEEALRGTREAAEMLQRFAEIHRLEERHWGPQVGTTLDMDRSAAAPDTLIG